MILGNLNICKLTITNDSFMQLNKTAKSLPAICVCPSVLEIKLERVDSRGWNRGDIVCQRWVVQREGVHMRESRGLLLPRLLFIVNSAVWVMPPDFGHTDGAPLVHDPSKDRILLLVNSNVWECIVRCYKKIFFNENWIK